MCPAMFRATLIHILNPLCLYDIYKVSILFYLFIRQLIKGFRQGLLQRKFLSKDEE